MSTDPTRSSIKVKLNFGGAVSSEEQSTGVQEKQNGRKGKKKHVCAKCGAGFTRAYDLKLHLKKHSDQRLKCTFCDLTFSKKDSQERHMAKQHRHTDLEVYVHCSICQQRYRRRHDLCKHMKIDHKIILDPPKSKGHKKKKTLKKAVNSEPLPGKAVNASVEIHPASLSASGNLEHNSRSILKYLMQTSPAKLTVNDLSGDSNTMDVMPNGVKNSRRHIPVTLTEGSNVNQGSVCVRSVQIENNGPLLGQRLLRSPSTCLSTPEKDLMQIDNSSSLCDIDENYSLPKGITVTPYHLNKSTSANTILPFEQGFSIGESKRYSLNFGLYPDPQLPENFMAESPENSLEGRFSPIKPGYLSRERTPVKNIDHNEKWIPDMSKHKDLDVITIDSDSNISSRSDIEVLSVTDEEIDSENDKRFSEKENVNENILNKKKRKLTDPETVQYTHNFENSNISIVTYQAVSPMKMARTVSPQEKCNIGRKLLINTQDLCQKSKVGDESVVKSHSFTHKMDFQVSNDRIAHSKSVQCSTSVQTSNQEMFSNVISQPTKPVSVSLSKFQAPPKITLFPTTVTTQQNVTSPNLNVNKLVNMDASNQRNKSKASTILDVSKKSVTVHSTPHNTHSLVNNILVKEVTLEKSGPSLFGKISENQNVSVMKNSNSISNNKVLVIGSRAIGAKSNGVSATGLHNFASSDIVNSNIVTSASVNVNNSLYMNSSFSKVPPSVNTPVINQQLPDSLDQTETNSTPQPSSSSSSSSVDELDPSNLESFYHSQEVKRTLRSIVTQPCASELLRAKREKLTIDDIYEEKIAKLLDKIGLNTFKGVPISQYFSGANSIPKRSHLSKEKMLGKDTKDLDPAQKVRHQEQIRARVASFIAMLERNKKERKPPPLKDPQKDIQSHSANINQQAQLSKRPVSSQLSQNTVTTNTLKQNLAQQNLPKQNSVTSAATGTIFDGVFKVPTKCAPSIYGPRPVKVVLKNNLTISNSIGTGIVTNCLGNVSLASLQFNQPVQNAVIGNRLSGLGNVPCNGLVSNLPSVATINLHQPMQGQITYRQPINVPLTNCTNVLNHKVILSPFTSTMKSNMPHTSNEPANAHFTIVNQPKTETMSPQRHAFVPCSASMSAMVLQNGGLMKTCTSPLKSDSISLLSCTNVNNSIKPITVQQIKVCSSPLKINTKPEVDIQTSKFDQLNISTNTAPVNLTCKVNPISPKSDSQQSLPEVDFLSGGCFQQSLVSPTKLINGNSCSNDSISPIKEGSLLNIQDINPAELQALMASPIKSFDMDNSNLSTASQNELLETLQHFLKDVPKSVSPQKGSLIISPPRKDGTVINSSNSFNILHSLKELSDSSDLSSSASTSVNLSSLFSPGQLKQQNIPGMPPNSTGKFFKNMASNVQVSIAQPSGRPSVSPSLPYFVPVSPSDESNQESCDIHTSFNDEDNKQKCDHGDGGDDCDMVYVPKKFVVNAPELHDENTMDRIVSVVEDLKALGES